MGRQCAPKGPLYVLGDRDFLPPSPFRFLPLSSLSGKVFYPPPADLDLTSPRDRRPATVKILRCLFDHFLYTCPEREAGYLSFSRICRWITNIEHSGPKCCQDRNFCGEVRRA